MKQVNTPRLVKWDVKLELNSVIETKLLLFLSHNQGKNRSIYLATNSCTTQCQVCWQRKMRSLYRVNLQVS